MRMVEKYKWRDDWGVFYGGEHGDACGADEVVSAEDYDALAAQCLELRERVAFLESREVCTVAHENVETCGYCQRDALQARLADEQAKYARLSVAYQEAVQSWNGDLARMAEYETVLLNMRVCCACPTHSRAIDAARATSSATVPPVYPHECICPTCGIRHGGTPNDGSF